ncbi:basic salivary proline-rich protein 3-like [Caloenas nicobarica]|uniref:basic salivary proline-rich protein 3-like n=1 Tax=Caloenas nicobarica TaxID=187106 RepID=UPI0032B7F4DC
MTQEPFTFADESELPPLLSYTYPSGFRQQKRPDVINNPQLLSRQTEVGLPQPPPRSTPELSPEHLLPKSPESSDGEGGKQSGQHPVRRGDPPGDPGGGAGGPALPRSAAAPGDAETDPCAGKMDPLAGEIDQIPGETDQVSPAPGNGAGTGGENGRSGAGNADLPGTRICRCRTEPGEQQPPPPPPHPRRSCAGTGDFPRPPPRPSADARWVQARPRSPSPEGGLQAQRPSIFGLGITSEKQKANEKQPNAIQGVPTSSCFQQESHPRTSPGPCSRSPGWRGADGNQPLPPASPPGHLAAVPAVPSLATQRRLTARAGQLLE